MPTVAVDALYLHAELRRPKMTADELDELCFDFGIGACGEYGERREMLRLTPPAELEDATTDETSGRAVYKIDVPANRYDLLCSEGVARALATFVGLAKPPAFALALDKPQEKIVVKAEVTGCRGLPRRR